MNAPHPNRVKHVISLSGTLLLATHGLAAALTREGAHTAIPVDIVAADIPFSEPHIERAVYLC